MTSKKLTAPGHVVQHAYLIKCLSLMHDFGALRVPVVGFAMFPGRAPSAALAAAHRVVTNALQLEYIEYVIAPDSRRYYALTLRGARMLHSVDASYCVKAGAPALRMQHREHREWCNIIALASRHRGMLSMSEPQIKGAMYAEIVRYFGHVPDAVTYYDDEHSNPCAMWHEVELSRRSQGSKNSGDKKLAHLVMTLIEKRYLTRGERTHDISLTLHCATAKIERECRRIVEAALAAHATSLAELDDDAEASYVAQIGTGASRRWFSVYVTQLPATVEGAWSCPALPWPGAPGLAESDVDVYLAAVATPVDQSRPFGAPGQLAS